MNHDPSATYRLRSVSGWATNMTLPDSLAHGFKRGTVHAQAAMVHLFRERIIREQNSDPGWVSVRDLELHRIEPDA